jgi:hypothetical protein
MFLYAWVMYEGLYRRVLLLSIQYTIGPNKDILYTSITEIHFEEKKCLKQAHKKKYQPN